VTVDSAMCARLTTGIFNGRKRVEKYYVLDCDPDAALWAMAYMKSLNDAGFDVVGDGRSRANGAGAMIRWDRGRRRGCFLQIPFPFGQAADQICDS